jgi:hypothetical protein
MRHGKSLALCAIITRVPTHRDATFALFKVVVVGEGGEDEEEFLKSDGNTF